MDGMGWDGWDGRLSPSASLLRAPYGANKYMIDTSIITTKNCLFHATVKKQMFVITKIAITRSLKGLKE